ncbi:MAG: hypothetical protein ACR2IJ_01255 [Fluviibacter sp.]
MAAEVNDISLNIEVLGLKEALRTLNKIDKAARREVTKDYKKIVAPVVEDIKKDIPLKPIMSGWGYRWSLVRTVTKKNKQSGLRFSESKSTDLLPWKGNERAMLKPYISGKKPRTFGAYTSSLGVFGIKWNAPAATLIDMAHTAHAPVASSMIDTLNRRLGSGKSRIMYKNWDRHQREIEANMQVLIRKIMDRTQKDLG